MKKRFTKVAIMLVAIAVGFWFIVMPRGRVISIPAECPNCMCNAAPTCVDIAYMEKGFPLISERQFDNENLAVDITKYASTKSPFNASVDYLIGFSSALAISYVLIRVKKYAHNRH